MNTGVTDLKSEVVAALATPQRVVAVAASFGVPRATMQARIDRCVLAGLVVRVGYGRYATVAAHTTPTHSSTAMKRPQPVRDMILAFLTQQRQAKEIANHIGRSVPNATGHLAAMGRRGLVVRTAYGCYQRSDLVLADSRPAKITRPTPTQDVVRACLNQPRHYSVVADLIGQSPQKAGDALHRLAKSGLAVFLGRGVFAPSAGDHGLGHNRQRSVRAARVDAGVGRHSRASCTP